MAAELGAEEGRARPGPARMCWLSPMRQLSHTRALTGQTLTVSQSLVTRRLAGQSWEPVPQGLLGGWAAVSTEDPWNQGRSARSCMVYGQGSIWMGSQSFLSVGLNPL